MVWHTHVLGKFPQSSDLYAHFREADLGRQGLPAVHVRVVAAVERSLQLVQLERREGCPVATLLRLARAPHAAALRAPPAAALRAPHAAARRGGGGGLCSAVRSRRLGGAEGSGRRVEIVTLVDYRVNHKIPVLYYYSIFTFRIFCWSSGV